MKHHLRKSMKTLRESLPPEEAMEKSRQICSKFTASKSFEEAKTILFYLPIRGEVQTSEAIEIAISKGKILAAPVVENGALVPRKLQLDKLKVGPFGVLEPFGTSIIPLENIDLVVVPGIAFDLHGGRIGYGKGYYDAFLKKIPKAKKIGLAYDFQIVSHFPKELHDVFTDIVFTEKRIINCEGLRKNQG
ncbi:MAG: 5-formyltetrahydrofolate cyclo-ligase [Candidatus Micrarchaeota archaeon]